MARILPQGSVAEFLAAYKVTEFENVCPPEGLTVKVWDLYGTKPENESSAPGTGRFIAAVVICEPCSRHITLDRRRLGG
jgi:hypothetical protein